MEIQKAVITAAGRSQRALPLQTLVGQDGVTKTALAIIIEEALSAGISEIALVIAPGDRAAFAAAAGNHASKLHFIEQSEPRGFGHAVLSAKPFTRDHSFLLLVGDHLYVSSTTGSCARQLVDVARSHRCAVSAVQPTHESKLPYYGAVGGRLLHGVSGHYDIMDVIEKPTPTVAEQRLLVPGLRAGHYLCFFGMHVLTPTVLDLLEEDSRGPGSFALSPALSRLARRERYLAYEVRGRRYDIGAHYGLLHAQLALALHGKDRPEVLEMIVDLLANRDLAHPA